VSELAGGGVGECGQLLVRIGADEGVHEHQAQTGPRPARRSGIISTGRTARSALCRSRTRSGLVYGPSPAGSKRRHAAIRFALLTDLLA
jgi:hypothetical protein